MTEPMAWLEQWIEQEFAGHGRALRRQNDPPLDGEPWMSMAEAKELVRQAVQAALARCDAQSEALQAALRAFIKAYGSQDSGTYGLDLAMAQAKAALAETKPSQGDAQPRVTDNDKGEITVTCNGNGLRGWYYDGEDERRTQMLAAREYVEGWCDGREAQRALHDIIAIAKDANLECRLERVMKRAEEELARRWL